MSTATLRNIVHRVQYIQPKGSQSFEEKEYLNQFQRRDPVYIWVVNTCSGNTGKEGKFHNLVHLLIVFTCVLEKVKFPPDCSWVVSHVLTDMVRPWFTRITFESNTSTYKTDDDVSLVLDTMEVKLIELGAKRNG